MGEFAMVPVARAVAAFAFATIATGMLVIMLMAIITSGTQLDAVELADVAGVARDGRMGSR